MECRRIVVVEFIETIEVFILALPHLREFVPNIISQESSVKLFEEFVANFISTYKLNNQDRIKYLRNTCSNKINEDDAHGLFEIKFDDGKTICYTNSQSESNVYINDIPYIKFDDFYVEAPHKIKPDGRIQRIPITIGVWQATLSLIKLYDYMGNAIEGKVYKIKKISYDPHPLKKQLLTRRISNESDSDSDSDDESEFSSKRYKKLTTRKRLTTRKQLAIEHSKAIKRRASDNDDDDTDALFTGKRVSDIKL